MRWEKDSPLEKQKKKKKKKKKKKMEGECVGDVEWCEEEKEEEIEKKKMRIMDVILNVDLECFDCKMEEQNE